MGQYYKACYQLPKGKKWNGLSTGNYKHQVECFDGKKRMFSCGAKLMEHSYIGNQFVNAFMDLIYQKPMRVVWAGDYADNEKGSNDNLHYLCEIHKPHIKHNENDYQFIINHTKKVYMDLSKVKQDKYGYRINPLPILAADGNGRGGGDYNGIGMEFVGTWARDIISVDSQKPSNFSEFSVKFAEN